MKRLTTLLFVLILTALTGSGHAAVPESMHDSKEALHDGMAEGLKSLADSLDICRFELPQATGHNTVRQQNEQQAPRRFQGCGKTNISFEQSSSLSIQTAICSENHKAVASARHGRGYYIYALRHIII